MEDDYIKNKRKKAEPEEIDISNGALFLMIKNLEIQLQVLEMRIKELDSATFHTRRIG